MIPISWHTSHYIPLYQSPPDFVEYPKSMKPMYQFSNTSKLLTRNKNPQTMLLKPCFHVWILNLNIGDTTAYNLLELISQYLYLYKDVLPRCIEGSKKFS